MGSVGWTAGLAAVAAIAAMATMQLRSNSELVVLRQAMQHPFTDNLAVLTYARHGGALGELEVALTASNSHLDTMLTRIEDSATTVAQPPQCLLMNCPISPCSICNNSSNKRSWLPLRCIR